MHVAGERNGAAVLVHTRVTSNALTLLPCNANACQYGRTLLHVAAVGNRLALARLLLDRGANPAATDVVRSCARHIRDCSDTQCTAARRPGTVFLSAA